MKAEQATTINDSRPVFPYHVHNQQKQPPEEKSSIKKVYLEISQNSQENTCARVSI